MPPISITNRLFIPHTPETLLEDISTYHDVAGLTFLTSESVCIKTDGVTPVHRLTPSKAAYGVYFGPNSPFNRCALISTKKQQSSNLADLYAIRMALQILLTALSPPLSKPYDRVKEVLLASDSAWVVDTMCRWVWEWQQHGWKTSYGEPVMYACIISRIHDQIKLAESRYGVMVKFWKVDSKYIAGANRLAHSAMKCYVHGDFEQHLCAPSSSWNYAGSYLDPAVWRLRHANLTISRLELPIRGETPWISSVRSYLVRQIALEESTTVFSFREKLARFFGAADWENVVAAERLKIAKERLELVAIRLGKDNLPPKIWTAEYKHIPGDTVVRKLLHLNAILRRMDRFEFPFCSLEKGMRVLCL